MNNNKRLPEMMTKLKEKGYSKRLVTHPQGHRIIETILKNKEDEYYSRYHTNPGTNNHIKQNGYLDERDILNIFQNSLKPLSTYK